ncbi:hypothetical protein JW979_14795 [bacterium]|nr:hypothetical protein [candidate division CSSED10-310 bacterium]
MKSCFFISVSLKVADAGAVTAFSCLINEMNYKGVLIGCQRRELWKIVWNCESVKMTQENLSITLAENTRVFVNPNKHVYDVFYNSLKMIQKTGADIFRVGICVRDKNDIKGKQALETLHKLYDYSSVIDEVSYNVLWLLDIKASSKDAARKIAEDIAITKGISKGLLANPHSQIISFDPNFS